MRALRVGIRNKIATYNTRDGVIVCGNKGYTIKFTFDEEWNECTTKTARFIWNGEYYDKEFTGDECPVPIINDATNLTVGVYAGDLKTTTPANIPCLISILCGTPKIIDENVKEYRDIAQQAAATAQKAAEDAVRAASVLVNPTIDVEKIEGGHRITIHDADKDKSFDVMNGANGGKDGVGVSKAEINTKGELVLTYTDGKSQNLGKVVGKDGSGGLTAEQLAQFNALVQWHTDSTYKYMTVSIHPANSTYEIGSTQDITFSWTFSEEVSAVSFNGQSQTASKTGSAKVTGISSASSYKVEGTRADGKKESKSVMASVNFHNKYYFGCAADPGTIDSWFIKRLNHESDFASSKPTFITIPTVNTGEYIWYAYPAKLGTSTFKMNGFNGGFNDAQIVSFTNGSGYTEDYYVYRSVESGLGSIEIQVL